MTFSMWVIIFILTMEKSQLLCTFTRKSYIDELLLNIINTYTTTNKIFVLQNTSDENEMYCTYNVSYLELQEKSFLKNTISVHRNKSTNTLYTINSINTMVSLLNDGIRDTSFKIDWELYRNMLIVTNESGLKKINTKIFKIVTL